MRHMHRRSRDSVAFTVLVSVLVLVGALVMALVVGLSGASSTVVVATALAALPVGPVVGCLLWLDRYEPEPRSLLAAGLLWGAFVATAAALLLQGLGGLVVPMDEYLSLTVAAPVVEEATKGLFLLFLLWWRRHELDGILDGIVYAGMIGVGFAFTENILYLASAYDGTPGVGPGGSGELAWTFVLRCLVSPFAHPLFTAFIGIGVGVAVASRTPLGRIGAPVVGYVVAVLTHALWNAASTGAFGGFVLVYVVVMAPVFVLLIGFALFRRGNEKVMLEAALADAARHGLLPETDIPWLVDLRARRESRRFALAHGGPQAARHMREYQQSAVELGFLHHRYLRGTPPTDFVLRGQDHMVRLAQLRPHVAFPGQVVPTR